jgi:hypothetical protein
MYVEMHDDSRDLGSLFSKQCGTQQAVFEAMDVQISQRKRLEQLPILYIEGVKAR